MNLLQRISTLAAALAVTCAPTLAAGAHGHATHAAPHPLLTPIVCNISGDADESLAYSQYVLNHNVHTPVLNFGITSDGTDSFGDLGAGAHIEGLDGTAFSSMVITASGFDPSNTLGPIVYLAYTNTDDNVDCYFAGSLAELGSPRPVRNQPGSYKFTFTLANMLSICGDTNFPFVPADNAINFLAIGVVDPGVNINLQSVVVNTQQVQPNYHAAAEDCSSFLVDVQVAAVK